MGILNQIVSIIIISQTNKQIALNYYHLGTTSIAFAPLFYFFTINFFNIKKNKFLTVFAILYSVTLPLLNFLAPSYLIKDVIWDSSVRFFIPVFDTPFLILAYCTFIFWFYSLYKILRLYKNSRSSYYRNKLKYILLGSIIPIIGFFAISVPIREIRRYPLDNFGITIGSILMVYGVLKYKALNITLIIRRGLIYSTLTFLITFSYLTISFLFQRFFFSQNVPSTNLLVIIPSSVIIALFFQPLNSFSIRLIDHLFYRKAYVPHELLNKISYEINNALSLEQLGTKLIRILKSAFSSEKILILLKNKNGKFKLINSKGVFIDKKYGEILSKNAHKLFNDQGVINVYDIVSIDLANKIQKMGIEMIAPLFINKVQTGYICFGPKKSDEIYSLEDVDVINTVANQAAVALENALLYDELAKEKRRIEKLLQHEIEVNKMKSEFIMMGSHSLRTPITIIKGYINSLYDKKDSYSDEDKLSIQSIYESTNNLSILVEDLLMLSNIQNKKTGVILEKVDLIPILRKVIQSFTSRAEIKGLKLEFIDNGISEAFVKGEAYQISIAINNLVDNAIKFTENGSVQIILNSAGDKYQIQVKDTGPGIPREEIKNLFTQFHQIRSSQYEAVPGNGLGLYIVKSIINAHNGECSATSQMGKGSTFTISLPQFTEPHVE